MDGRARMPLWMTGSCRVAARGHRLEFLAVGRNSLAAREGMTTIVLRVEDGASSERTGLPARLGLGEDHIGQDLHAVWTISRLATWREER